MTSKQPRPRNHPARSNRLALGLSAAAVVSLFSLQSAQAANGTWNTTASNGNWEAEGTENNWGSAATFPGSLSTANADVATFSNNSNFTTIAINGTTPNSSSLFIGAIGFTGTALATNYTIGSTSGNSLLVASNADATSTTNQIFISGFGRSGAATAVTETINAPIVLRPLTSTTNGFYVFQNNSTGVVGTPHGDALIFNGAVSGGTTTGTVTLTLRGANTNANNAVNGVISNGGAAGGVNVTKTDAGTWKLAGNNTYTGVTTVTGGTLVLTGTNTLSSASNAINVGTGSTLSVSSISNNLGGATRVNLGGGGSTGRLLYTGTGETTSLIVGSNAFSGTPGMIVDQSGTGTLKFTANTAAGGVAQTLTLQGSTSGVGEMAGVISNGTAPTVSFIKAGTGTWTLSGANTYTGTTTINAGTLSVTGSTAVGSAVTVNSGGTLRGTGTIGGALTIASGGTLAAGVNASTVGTLTFSSSVTANSGSTFSFKLLSNSGTFDAITSSGVVTLGSATFSLADIGTGFWTGTSSPFSIVHGSSISGIFAGFLDGSTVVAGANTFTLNYTSTDVTLTAVAIPEPSACAAIVGLGAIGIAAYRRRQRKVS